MSKESKYNLILGDCLQKMQSIPESSIDCIIADLPYGVTNNKDDKVIPFDMLWEQLDRVIKDNGCIALFAQGLFYVDLVNSNREHFKYDLVWDKVLTSGFLNANRMPLRSHEQIAIFYKKQPTYNPQKTKGKPNHSKGKDKGVSPINNNYGEFGFVDNKETLGDMKHPTSIIKFAKIHPSKAIHPTQKSVECIEWLIKTYTNAGDTVLDPCMGSGTTGVACANTGRNFIGIELDNKYLEIAKKRIFNDRKDKDE